MSNMTPACSGCQTDVRFEDGVCPNCGKPVRSKGRRGRWRRTALALVILVLIVSLLVIGGALAQRQQEEQAALQTELKIASLLKTMAEQQSKLQRGQCFSPQDVQKLFDSNVAGFRTNYACSETTFSLEVSSTGDGGYSLFIDRSAVVRRSKLPQKADATSTPLQ